MLCLFIPRLAKKLLCSGSIPLFAQEGFCFCCFDLSKEKTLNLRPTLRFCHTARYDRLTDVSRGSMLLGCQLSASGARLHPEMFSACFGTSSCWMMMMISTRFNPSVESEPSDCSGVPASVISESVPLEAAAPCLRVKV